MAGAVLCLFHLSATAQIRISEVGFDGVDYEGASMWVEFYNAGDADVDVSSLILCDFPRYPVVNTLTVLGGGSTTIPAGGYLVVAWPDLGGGETHAEVGLYTEDAGGDFGNVDKILDYMQFGEAAHQREGTAEGAGLWTVGEFVESAASGMSLQLVNPDVNGASNWIAAPATPNAANDISSLLSDVRINEVGFDGVDYEGASMWVELYNAGDADVDVASLILCDFPRYPVINTMTVLGGGSTTIPAGGYLVLAWPELGGGEAHAEVGIYTEDAGGDFGNPEKLLDYMQFGEAAHQREGVAQDAGLWTVGAFVESAPSGMSLQLVDAGAAGVANWVAAEATPNAANGGSAMVFDVRVNEIGFDGVDYEGASIWVELYNAGDADVDVSNLILCDFPRYPVINAMTVLGGGSTTIPAGGFLVLAWPDLGGGETHAEVGLYTEDAGGDFGNVDKILDYMQFGEAAHRREDVAEGAGLWTIGEFVASAASGSSLQLVDASGTGAANWISAAATPNAVNNTPTSIDDFDELPGDFRLFANFPNPFNPETAINYELNRNGSVSLSVFDMLGQKIADLFEGSQSAGVYSVTWDGRDANGNVAASGLYLYRLTLDGQFSQSRVMTLLK